MKTKIDFPNEAAVTTNPNVAAMFSSSGVCSRSREHPRKTDTANYVAELYIYI